MDKINIKALKYTCLVIIGLIIFLVLEYYFPIISIFFVVAVCIFMAGFSIYFIYIFFDEIIYKG